MITDTPVSLICLNLYSQDMLKVVKFKLFIQPSLEPYTGITCLYFTIGHTLSYNKLSVLSYTAFQNI